jgi:hypothetical protein
MAGQVLRESIEERLSPLVSCRHLAWKVVDPAASSYRNMTTSMLFTDC